MGKDHCFRFNTHKGHLMSEPEKNDVWPLAKMVRFGGPDR